MRVATLFVIILPAVLGLPSMWMSEAKAQSSPSPQNDTAIMGTSESPTVSSEQTLKDDPVCDPTYRPTITKIEPDEFQAGAKIVIMGEHFGKKKDCLHEVTFGPVKATEFTLQGDDKIEVTVPDSVATGMLFVSVVTGGGAAKTAVLVKK
ncbi:MAG TPA: IPT/TIG domain-containing protein [Nitrospirales bacterium]|nr:IPT/TIG domain-containing protein [Nitrospirales bacterium]